MRRVLKSREEDLLSKLPSSEERDAVRAFQVSETGQFTPQSTCCPVVGVACSGCFKTILKARADMQRIGFGDVPFDPKLPVEIK